MYTIIIELLILNDKLDTRCHSMRMLRALDDTRSFHSPGGSERGARMIIIAPTAEMNSFDNFVVA